MLSIDASQLSDRENYKLMVGAIVPRPIAFVTTVSDTGVVNGAPFSYFNIVTSNPPMISLGIQRKQEQHKDTARNIMQQKECVVHMVNEHNVQLINQTAASLPSDVSEIERTGFTLVASESVAVPGVKEANIRLECRLVEVVQLPKDKPSVDLVICEVLRYHIAEHVYENGTINVDVLKAVSRLAGQSYGLIGKQFEIERPE